MITRVTKQIGPLIPAIANGTMGRRVVMVPLHVQEILDFDAVPYAAIVFERHLADPPRHGPEC
jgi:hypothetical protein